MSWPTSNPISRELDDFWKESQSLWQQWWSEADLDTKMMTGQQDYWNQFYGANYRNQKVLMFNKILRIVNMISGYQRRNRMATIIVPADNDPDNGLTADQMTKALTWVMREDNTYEKISEAFEGAVTCGLNLLQCWMDFREDPENGEIRTSRIPFNSFLMDNFWTKQDLSDCDRIWTRRYITDRQLQALIPGIKGDLPSLGKGYAAKDGKFQYLSQNWTQNQENMFSYDEYWVRDYKEVKKVLDTTSGEVIEWNGTREQFRRLRDINQNVELIKAMKPTVKLHVLVNNHSIYEESEPYGLSRFPFVPTLCYHFPEVQNYAYRYQGVVRNTRDSQIELNRRRNRMLDILDAQVQSGIMVKEDALVNPEDAFFQGPGKVLYFKNSANLATDQVQFQAPPVPSGWMELCASLDQEIMQIVGTPEELYGQDMNGKDMSGIMMQLKMGAGLTSLQNIFDRLNQSQKCLGDIQLEMMQKNFSAGKIAKIIGEQPSEEFFNWNITRFHTAAEEAELTTTQRQLQFMQAIFLKQMDIPISNKYLLEKSTLQGKKQIMEDIEAQEKQQQQMQQQAAMLELQKGEIINRSIEAKAQSDFANAEKNKIGAYTEIAKMKEMEARTTLDKAKTELEHTKAVHELHDMSDDRLIKMSNFILEMQAKQAMIDGDEDAETLAQVAGITAGIEQAESESKPQTKPDQGQEQNQ
jgi:hypothetical protein